MVDELLFEVMTPLGTRIRCTRTWWEFLVGRKHPVLRNLEREVMLALAAPDMIRRSRRHPAVMLFYRGSPPRWLCAVCRRQGAAGFLITAYPTDAIKAGELIWTRSD